MQKRKLKELKEEYLYKDTAKVQLLKKYNITITEFEKLEKTIGFRKRIINGRLEKRCNDCNVWKDCENDFTPVMKRDGKTIYSKQCKFCRALALRNKRKLDPTFKDKENAYKRKWNKENPEKAKVIQDRYQEKHKTRIQIRERKRLKERYNRKRQEEILEKIKAKRQLINEKTFAN